MNEVLNELDQNVRELEASAVVSVEGLPIASKLPEQYEDTIVAAMTAAMLSLGDKIANNLNKGTLEKIMIEGVQELCCEKTKVLRFWSQFIANDLHLLFAF